MIGKIIISIFVIFAVIITIITGFVLEFVPTNSWKSTLKIIVMFIVFLVIVNFILFIIVYLVERIF